MKGKVNKMARERMITRTIKSTEAECMMVDVTNASVFNAKYELVGEFTKEEFLEAMRKADSEELKIVSVISTATKETLYGMPEEEFMKAATILPPRFAKAE